MTHLTEKILYTYIYVYIYDRRDLQNRKNLTFFLGGEVIEIS